MFIFFILASSYYSPYRSGGYNQSYNFAHDNPDVFDKKGFMDEFQKLHKSYLDALNKGERIDRMRAANDFLLIFSHSLVSPRQDSIKERLKSTLKDQIARQRVNVIRIFYESLDKEIQDMIDDEESVSGRSVEVLLQAKPEDEAFLIEERDVIKYLKVRLKYLKLWAFYEFATRIKRERTRKEIVSTAVNVISELKRKFSKLAINTKELDFKNIVENIKKEEKFDKRSKVKCEFCEDCDDTIFGPIRAACIIVLKFDPLNPEEELIEDKSASELECLPRWVEKFSIDLQGKEKVYEVEYTKSKKDGRKIAVTKDGKEEAEDSDDDLKKLGKVGKVLKDPIKQAQGSLDQLLKAVDG